MHRHYIFTHTHTHTQLYAGMHTCLGKNGNKSDSMKIYRDKEC